MARTLEVTCRTSTDFKANGDRYWLGVFRFEQRDDNGTRKWVPPMEVVRSYANLMVHPIQAYHPDMRAWHETYLETLEYDAEKDFWTATIVEPSVN